MTLGDGVSANRLNIIDDGQVLIEPRCCSAACSGDMAVALAVIAVSDCVFAGDWHLYIRRCSCCGCRVWHVWEVLDNPYMCGRVVAAVLMSPAHRNLLAVQVASVQQNKGGVAGLQSECVVKIYRPGWKTCCIHAALCYCELC